MQKALKKMIFGMSAILLVGITFLTPNGEAVPLSSHLYPPVLAFFWEKPAKPEEKWLSPRREEDEWYKQRQKQKYR